MSVLRFRRGSDFRRVSSTWEVRLTDVIAVLQTRHEELTASSESRHHTLQGEQCWACVNVTRCSLKWCVILGDFTLCVLLNFLEQLSVSWQVVSDNPLQFITFIYFARKRRIRLCSWFDLILILPHFLLSFWSWKSTFGKWTNTFLTCLIVFPFETGQKEGWKFITSFLADLSASMAAGTDLALLPVWLVAGWESCKPEDNCNSFCTPSNSSISLSLS